MSNQNFTSSLGFSSDVYGTLRAAARPSRKTLSQRNRKIANAAGAVAEALEGRRHFSISSLTLSSGILTIVDDNDPVLIEVNQTGSTIRIHVNGNTTAHASYTTAQITNKIVVNGTGGDDTIFFSRSGTPNYGGGGSAGMGSAAVSVRCEVDAGAGNDVVETTNQNDSVVGGDGNDTLRGGSGDDTIKGDNIYTTTSSSTTTSGFSDSILGDEGDDWLYGQEHYDYLDGGANADHLYGDYVTATSAGITDANDTLSGGTGPDTLQGDCDSVLLSSYGYGGWDVLDGGADSDWLYGEAPNSTAPGNDVISGGDDSDHCYGGYGNDEIFDAGSGGFDGGDDTLYGGAGNDTITLSGGADRAYGGDGNDTFWGVGGDGASDWVDGEAGSDCILGTAADPTDQVFIP